MKTTTASRHQDRAHSDDGYVRITYPLARCVDLDTGKPVTPPIHFKASLERSMRRADTFYSPELLHKLGSLDALK